MYAGLKAGLSLFYQVLHTKECMCVLDINAHILHWHVPSVDFHEC